MVSAINKRELMAWSVLIFVLSPILSLEETACPGATYVLAMIIPTLMVGINLRGYAFQYWHLTAIALWAFAIISTIFGLYGTLDVMALCKYGAFVIYFIVVTKVRYTIHDLKFIFQGYTIVAVLVAVLIVMSWYFGYAHVDSENFMGRYSVGITGVYKNPNYLTSFINVSAFILLWLVFCTELRTKVKFAIFAILGLYVVAIFFTGTRAALMTFGMLLCFVLSSIFLKKKHRKLFFAFIVVVVGAIIIFLPSLGTVWDMYLGNRTMSEDTGREVAWLLALHYIEESPLLGCGLNSFENIRTFGVIEYLHNIYLELVLNQGLIGLVLFFITTLGGITRVKKQDRYFVYLFMFASGFQMMFQNGVNEVNLWRFIILNRIVFNYSIYSQFGIVQAIEKLVRTSDKKMILLNSQ